MGCACGGAKQGGMEAQYVVIYRDGTEQTFASLPEARVEAGIKGGKVSPRPVYKKLAGETA